MIDLRSPHAWTDIRYQVFFQDAHFVDITYLDSQSDIIYVPDISKGDKQ